MNLEDLIPKTSKLYLSATKKEYTLRPWTLKDQIWMKKEYGDRLTEIFNEKNIDIVAISRMAFRCIVDKSDFASIKRKDIDENGHEIVYEIGGYQRLIEMIEDTKEQMHMYAAVLECIGYSAEIVGALRSFGEGNEEKKTV